ncbi:hypothetical protein GJ496_009820 [Pomphorhynchus laevis]|nr:hypothetical protein GJ496_009820 [Pomphorhynchus laevis]
MQQLPGKSSDPFVSKLKRRQSEFPISKTIYTKVQLTTCRSFTHNFIEQKQQFHKSTQTDNINFEDRIFMLNRSFILKSLLFTTLIIFAMILYESILCNQFTRQVYLKRKALNIIKNIRRVFLPKSKPIRTSIAKLIK